MPGTGNIGQRIMVIFHDCIYPWSLPNIVFLVEIFSRMELFSLFDQYHVDSGEGIEIQSGSLHLLIKRISSGWGFKVLETTGPFPEILLRKLTPDIQVSESELYQTGKSGNLCIAPSLPVKPVVLKNSGMHILPGQSMHFFVKIPLNLQFYFDEPSVNNLISEYPMYRLSDTWFGEPDEGESAFALGNFYQKDADLLDVRPWEAICPVNILNHSNLMLEVQRLIIRVENLALVRSDQRIMTSMVEIEYKGRDQVSSVSYHLDKSLHGASFIQMTAPRSNVAKSSLKINFHFIKNIYQW